MHYGRKPTLRSSRALAIGSMLASGLNSAEGSSGEHLLALLERCRELPRVLAEAKQTAMGGTAIASGYSPSWMAYQLGSTSRSRELLAEINRLLGRYKLRWRVPSVLFASAGEIPALQISAVALRRRKLGSRFNTEIAMVELLLRLAEESSLDRIRRCSECGRWFMARKRDQSYCEERHRRRKDRRQFDKKALSLYQKAYRRADKVRAIRARMKRARPSDRKQMNAQIVELERERKALLDQRRKLVNAKN